MKNLRTLALLLLLSSCGWLQPSHDQPLSDPNLKSGDFVTRTAEDAQSVINRYCLDCHGEGSLAPLTGEEELLKYVERGRADQSELYTLVRDGDMPPNGPSIPGQDAKILREWIEGLE